MTGKDVAFIMLFMLFILSVMGNAFFLYYFVQSDQDETALEQKIASLEAEKNNLYYQYDRQNHELEEENEDLQKEITSLNSELRELQRELESQSGNTISYAGLVDSLRMRVYDLEAEAQELENDLNECRSQQVHCDCSYWYDPHCSCYPCQSCGTCHHSVSVSNVSGTFRGNAYDAIIFVYLNYYPCNALRIYVDILDVDTIQIVGVDWD